MVPVGLGNNTTEYDTSILLDQGDNETGPPNTGDGLDDNDEPNETTENQEPRGDNKDAIDSSSPDAKVTTIKKVAIKKESIVPAKRTRSQVDRIADAEIARFDTKKAKFETEQQRFKTLESVGLAKAREKTRQAVEVRQAELEVEKERIRTNHEYRMEMLKCGRIPPPDPRLSTSLDSFPPYPATWPSSAPFVSSQPYTTPYTAPYTAPQPPVPVEAPLPPPEHSRSGGQHDSPESQLDGLFDETG